LGSNYLKWNTTVHWADRDGLTPPSPLLIFAIDEALRMWRDKQPTLIHDKPLPNIHQLNAAIPQSEWERGPDGQLQELWKHIVIIRLINPSTGEIYKYEADTTGAHIAYDKLRESVMTMRMLRGTRVMPLIHLDERPMKTKYNKQARRPHFEIVGWKTPGDDAKAVPAKPVAPQLTGPAASPAETRSAPAAATSQTRLPPNDSAQPFQAKPKPPVKLAGETLATMGEVKPPTMGEIINDELPW
jgi:hypothetical protein